MSVATSGRYLDSLLQGRPSAPAAFSAPGFTWLNRLRAHALERVGALSVPTTRDEDWRFTDISPLTRLTFQPAHDLAVLPAGVIARYAIPEAAARLVFVDGVYAPALSFNRCGIVVDSLAAGVLAQQPAPAEQLGRHVEVEHNAFGALNTAFLQDGALLVAPRNRQAAGAVHVLFVATRAGLASHPRCLVVAESGSAVTLVEDFVSLQEGAYFTNAVTEMAIADNAEITHVRVQREGAAAFHIAQCAVSLARASRYRAVSVALGASISRYNLAVVQSAEAAECSVDGLALIGGRQLADTHTLIDHAMPNGISRQLHKCVVDDQAHAVFNGKIIVRPGAQRTSSNQSSRNLLLSAGAKVDTKPQLEIFADDVKCAHGATVGQLDADELFYLKSRGLPDTVARQLLTYAFGAEVIERIPLETLKKRLEQAMLEQRALQL